jgi:hypothetical protein
MARLAAARYSMAMYRDFWTLSADSVVAMAAGRLPLSFVNPAAAEASGLKAAARL